jgi:hypothetical protein
MFNSFAIMKKFSLLLVVKLAIKFITGACVAGLFSLLYILHNSFSFAVDKQNYKV